MPYKYNRYGGVTWTDTDKTIDIPADNTNADWQRFVAYRDGGGQVSAADPAPLVYNGIVIRESKITTTNATATELFRATLAQLTVYRARVELFAVDQGNGNTRDITARIVVKRLNAGAIIVPNAAAANVTVVSDHRDGTAGTWAIVPSVSGNDFIITVTGAAGKNIDWFCRLSVENFTPGGA